MAIFGALFWLIFALGLWKMIELIISGDYLPVDKRAAYITVREIFSALMLIVVGFFLALNWKRK